LRDAETFDNNHKFNCFAGDVKTFEIRHHCRMEILIWYLISTCDVNQPNMLQNDDKLPKNNAYIPKPNEVDDDLILAMKCSLYLMKKKTSKVATRLLCSP